VLRQKFPPRPVVLSWPETFHPREAVLERLLASPFASHNPATHETRRRGLSKVLAWLTEQPGQSWQERWLASGAEHDGGDAWPRLPLVWLQSTGRARSYDNRDVLAGLLVLVCGDVIRPSLSWLLSRRSDHLARLMAGARDPQGFVKLAALGEGFAKRAVTLAFNRIAVILAAKGGLVPDVTVGDCAELVELQRGHHYACADGRRLFYQLLHAAGTFPAQAPPSLRMLAVHGQLSPEQLIDRYGIACRLVRDLLVDYLRERQPSLDHSSLHGIADSLGRLFWRDLEIHHPGIHSLRLAPDVATAWKERIKTKTTKKKTTNGEMVEVHSARAHAIGTMIQVRGFYLDLAQWATEDPARWGPWAAPCPIRDADVEQKKQLRRHKARMDQRTRERLPVLPVLVRTVEQRRSLAATLLQAAKRTAPGTTFTVNGETLLRPSTPHAAAGKVWADELSTGRRRDLSHEEHEAFWAWGAVEVLRASGVRVEEMLELSHHSFVQYRLPTTGELVPLLQIAPSKTDTERLLLISPELADVLSVIICRIRDAHGAVPLVSSYDPLERVWNPPMPLLFQRQFGTENRALPRSVIRNALNAALGATGLTSPDKQPLHFTPHDFRRLFITDAVLNGLPPHVAQVICGHSNINTTMGYKAIYPEEAINAHRAFIARRRATRPSEEYRTPTEQEWEEFLGHFQRRKVSVGTCGRAFGTSCIHEHSCVRCSLLRPDPAQKPRLVEIRNNLIDRITEAEHEGWLGEVEGLQISLAGAQQKLAQLDQLAARNTTTHLGMPDFSHIAGRSNTDSRP
jgi:integrase